MPAKKLKPVKRKPKPPPAPVVQEIMPKPELPTPQRRLFAVIDKQDTFAQRLLSALKAFWVGKP